jgi:hypothetical protein
MRWIACAALLTGTPLAAGSGSLVIAGGAVLPSNKAVYRAFLDRVPPASPMVVIIPSASGEHVAVICGSDGVHEAFPDACLPPSHKAVVAGIARAIALGQVAPWRTGSQNPENAGQHALVIDARHASRFVGQQRLDHAPLEVFQVISAHADVESPRSHPWQRWMLLGYAARKVANGDIEQ